MEFAKLLKKYREASSTGLNRTDLARELGFHPSYIMQIEKGSKAPPPVDRVKDIAKALKLTPEQRDALIYASVNERWDTELHEVERIYKGKVTGMSFPKMDRDPEIKKIPLISWVTAGQLSPVIDEYPAGWAEDWVYTTRKGERMFALKVNGDSMEPVFKDGDVIIVDPDAESYHNDFVIAKDILENEATFKQLRRLGDQYMLHPLNPAYVDIVMDGSKRWVIAGKVVQRIENL